MSNIYRSKSQLKMREDFYDSYDPVLHRSLFEKFLESVQNLDKYLYLGGGSHFDSWKINRVGFSSQVISISNRTFYEEKGSKGLLDWAERMQMIKESKIPLVPPFEILNRSKTAAVMMPFGKIDKQRVRNPSKTLTDEIGGMNTSLIDRGLVINDTLQIRFSEAAPFVCDFSDLIDIE